MCAILIPKVVFGDLPVNPIFWMCLALATLNPSFLLCNDRAVFSSLLNGIVLLKGRSEEIANRYWFPFPLLSPVASASLSNASNDSLHLRKGIKHS